MDDGDAAKLQIRPFLKDFLSFLLIFVTVSARGRPACGNEGSPNL
jgi:hypothetical protein